MTTRKKATKIRVTAWLPFKLAQRFRAFAEEQGHTQSWYVTNAIRGIVEKKGEKKKSPTN